MQAGKARLKLSEQERRMRGLLNSAFISSDALIKKWYGDDLPFNARESVVGLINRLDRKMTWNDDPFEIVKVRDGRSMKVRIKRRKRNEVRDNRSANDARGVR
jgi:hypothetical protein